MSETKEHPRPPQTTMVGWVILIGSVYVALQAIDSLSSLRTMAMQEFVDDMLKAMGHPEGFTQADGLQMLRVTTVVAAVCSAASAVLAWFALRRDRGARIALSVLAAPLMLSTAVTGGFVAVMVVASVVLLWVQPSRNWFAGLPPLTIPDLPSPPTLDRRSRKAADADSAREAERDAEYAPRPSGEPHTTAPPVVAPTGDTGARPVEGFGTQQREPGAPAPIPGAPPSVPAGAPFQPAVAPAIQGAPGQRPPRPKALVRAAVVTFVFAGLGFISSVITTMVALTAGEKMMNDLLDQQQLLRDQGITAAELGSLLALTGGILAFFCVLGIASAALALSGNPVGRTLLMMVAGFVCAFCLFGVLSSPVLLVPAIAAGFVVLQANRPEVTAWLRAVAGR